MAFEFSALSRSPALQDNALDVAVADKMPAKSSSKPIKIGVVLGAGAARGWSHVGVLRELDRMGLPIDIVCGCSSGALVAASYAAGRLNALENLAERMTTMRMLRFFDVSWTRGGLIEGRWIVNFLRQNVGDVRIEDLPVRFGSVATEYGNGREVWLKNGSLIDATRASIALPGLLTPISMNGRVLLDGALVNPLPVALCRALGADVIIGVRLDKHIAPSAETLEPDEEQSGRWKWGGGEREQMPRYYEVISDAIFTMTSMIQRVRLATNPVDLMITPDLSELGVMDFHRAREFIDRGAAGTRRAEGEIKALISELDQHLVV